MLKFHTSCFWAACLVLLYSQFSNASFGPPGGYWQVEPPLDYNDTLYAGWKQIPIDAEIEVYNGLDIGRTYAHHPALLAVNNTIYLIHSSAVIDEDSMGMELWGAASTDGGQSWTPSTSILPAALLPNQTDVANFSYWCNEAIWQRAIGGLAVLNYRDEIWAVGQTTDFYCWGDIGSGTKGAGRIARKINSSLNLLSDPCWLHQNNYTSTLLYNSTIYGTKYNMKFCDGHLEMEAMLSTPKLVPAWSDWLYNIVTMYAEDGVHYMQEVTHAVWVGEAEGTGGGYWQRFWRDITGVGNTMRVWVEYSRDEEGREWYPSLESEFGNNITETNIPDAETKQFLGTLGNGQDRYLISNPRYNTELIRQPLTIAVSRGADLSYKNVGVLRTNASSDIAPDTRDYKNQGFSYPVAVQVGDKLVVAYSENKQNIWISLIDVKNLPGM